MEMKSAVIEISDGSESEVDVAPKPTGKGVKKKDPIQCPQCPRMFTKATNFKIHMCTHTGEQLPKNFQCNVCAKMFQNNSLLKRHLSSHLGNSRERRHKCLECGKAYMQLPHLREHELKQHGKGEKRFQCTECGVAFYRKADYERHYRIHIGERNFSCHMCTRSFIQKCNLDMHIKTHTGERNFKCEQCGKRPFSVKLRFRLRLQTRWSHGVSPVVLRLYLRVRKKRDTIKCPQCPRTFQNNSLLKRHSVSHLGSNRERPHKCVECAKAYTLLPHLREHELKQHGKGEKRFQCTECEFAFYRKADYERHYRTHIGERNFSCHMCTRSFIQKCNLDMHIKTHTGERNFKCEKCGKSFIARSKLVRHYKQGVHCKF